MRRICHEVGSCSSLNLSKEMCKGDEAVKWIASLLHVARDQEIAKQMEKNRLITIRLQGKCLKSVIKTILDSNKSNPLLESILANTAHS